MTIKRNHWIILTLLALISIGIWSQYSYPQLATLNLSINKKEALEISAQHLRDLKVDPSKYQVAIVFRKDGSADQYLQKTLGFKKYLSFIKKEDIDIFYWFVRYFNEKQPEEYRVLVSSADGDVMTYRHVIEHKEAREEKTKEESRKIVIKKLSDQFGFNPALYTLKSDNKVKRDHRTDYSFVWQKKDINIPWSEKKDTGTAKLLINASVSGDEILNFGKNILSIPKDFSRDIAKRKNPGKNILTIVKILSTLLFISSIFFVISRRNHLAMHTTKRFYLGIIGLSFLLSLLASLNLYQELLIKISTNSSFMEYLINHNINLFIGSIFVTVAVIMPALSGELLHFETSKQKREGSFLYYVRTTFFTKNVSQSIMLGYLTAIIMLGIQSLTIAFGKKYLGVWEEHSFLTQMTSTYIPVLAAFTIGFKASINEELMYRLFAINLGKKIFKNTILAVLISSLIWGFAHSNYPVFPVWFRGLEVTLLGLFLASVYLKFGIIPVIIAHYLFDVFWSVADFLLGSTSPYYVNSALFVLLLPAGFALITFVINKKGEEKPLQWKLNKHQIYNKKILTEYLENHKELWTDQPIKVIAKEIASHGWDIAVVEMALEHMKEKGQNQNNT